MVVVGVFKGEPLSCCFSCEQDEEEVDNGDISSSSVVDLDDDDKCLFDLINMSELHDTSEHVLMPESIVGLVDLRLLSELV